MVFLFLRSVTVPSTHLVLGDLVGLSARLTMTKWSLPARYSHFGGGDEQRYERHVKKKKSQKYNCEKNECDVRTGWGVTGVYERLH